MPWASDHPSKTTNGWFAFMCCQFAASSFTANRRLTLGSIISDRTGKCDDDRLALAAL